MNLVDSKVFIILPTFNRISNVKKFIEALSQQTFQKFDLILIDDGSSDQTSDLVVNHLRNKARCIRGQGDWWWGGSLHQGYIYFKKKYASAEIQNDYVLIMNDDTFFAPDFIEIGVEVMKSKGSDSLLFALNCDVNSGEVIDRGVNIDWANRKFVSAKDIAEVNCFATRGLMLSSSAFVRLNGFRPNLLPHYLSDYEFTVRAIRSGLTPCTDERFRLSVDFEQTAPSIFEKRDQTSFWGALKYLFSKRCKQNPIYRTIFTLLSCPIRYWPRHLASIWISFLKIVWKIAFNPRLETSNSLK